MTNNSNSAPRVHIVILNWNGWKDSIECLESVLRSDYQNYQIVLCDNDSQDGSVEKIQAWANGELLADATSEVMAKYSQPPIQKPLGHQVLSANDVSSNREVDSSTPLVIIRTGGNLGFAGGNNVGMRYALQQPECEYVWLLNNDTVIVPDTLSHMVNHSRQLLASGVANTCGSVQRYYYFPDKIQALGGFRYNAWTGICTATLGMGSSIDGEIDHNQYREQLHAIHGCSWLLPRDFLESIGLMEERYFLYYEEIDWALRSKDKYTHTYADQAIVYHKEGGSIGSHSIDRKRGSLMSEFYTNRNKFKVARKFFPLSIPVVFSFVLLIAFKRLLEGDAKRAWMLTKVAFGKQRFNS